MKAALTATLLLEDGDVANLGTDSVRPKLDVEVAEAVLEFLGGDVLESVAKGCFLIEWVVSVVVALHDAFIVTLANRWDQIQHDLPEEIHRIDIVVSLKCDTST